MKITTCFIRACDPTVAVHISPLSCCVLLTVVEPALNRRAACAQLNEQDTLTLACLHLPSHFSLKWRVVRNSPFGSRGALVSLSLPLSPRSLSLHSLLPGHCAHSLSAAISSKLHEAHYSHIPPRGRESRPGTDDWPTTQTSLNSPPPSPF